MGPSDGPKVAAGRTTSCGTGLNSGRETATTLGHASGAAVSRLKSTATKATA